MNFLQENNNIIVHHVDTTLKQTIVPVLSKKTRMVLLETPTNPLFRIADIKAISDLVHEYNPDILVVVDNTM